MTIKQLLSAALLTSSFMAIASGAAYAEEDSTLRDSNRCTRYFQSYEQQYKIPPNLLKAVSVTESGVYHKESKRLVPWPWAVNSQGKGYFFKTKQEAIAAVRTMLNKGISSIDVGCMQINLHYHPKAFSTLDQAFEPKYNIAYAANFLQDNFARQHSWRTAVASYHSETPELGRPYMKKVLELWRKEPNLPFGVGPSVAAPAYQNAVAREVVSPSRMPSRSFSPSMKARRNSSMFIKVHREQSPDAAKMNMVENITQNVLRKYPSKTLNGGVALD
jgi:soluble lytic murein transglycosylase-like protein